ncbi:MAG: nitrilase-related carbon-nitrogen hydrolase, partial [Alphaproteobacteria bacterium]|nr:nitrilase-related carbon-nitrogen hydrolase [Alphaproteobacteria bacterium]
MSRKITAAIVQDGSVVFDRDKTIEKVSRLTAEATGQGAELVVFPEAFVSAYPKGLDFGARVGGRTPEGRADFQRYFDSSIEVPGAACEAIGKAARAAGVHLVIGVI